MEGEHKFAYGLQNASAYLHKLRRDKFSEHNISRETINDKSKMLDSYEMPTSKESP